jgi:hypothetical protein
LLERSCRGALVQYRRDNERSKAEYKRQNSNSNWSALYKSDDETPGSTCVSGSCSNKKGYNPTEGAWCSKKIDSSSSIATDAAAPAVLLVLQNSNICLRFPCSCSTMCFNPKSASSFYADVVVVIVTIISSLSTVQSNGAVHGGQ